MKTKYTIEVGGKKILSTTNFTLFLLNCDKFENDWRYCRVGGTDTEARFAKHPGT